MNAFQGQPTADREPPVGTAPPAAAHETAGVLAHAGKAAAAPGGGAVRGRLISDPPAEDGWYFRFVCVDCGEHYWRGDVRMFALRPCPACGGAEFRRESMRAVTTVTQSFPWWRLWPRRVRRGVWIDRAGSRRGEW